MKALDNEEVGKAVPLMGEIKITQRKEYEELTLFLSQRQLLLLRQ